MTEKYKVGHYWEGKKYPEGYRVIFCNPLDHNRLAMKNQLVLKSKMIGLSEHLFYVNEDTKTIIEMKSE